jgi:hypothetical protein
MNCIEAFSYIDSFKTVCTVLLLIIVFCGVVGSIAANFSKNASDNFFDLPES